MKIHKDSNLKTVNGFKVVYQNRTDTGRVYYLLSHKDVVGSARFFTSHSDPEAPASVPFSLDTPLYATFVPRLPKYAEVGSVLRRSLKLMARTGQLDEGVSLPNRFVRPSLSEMELRSIHEITGTALPLTFVTRTTLDVDAAYSMYVEANTSTTQLSEEEDTSSEVDAAAFSAADPSNKVKAEKCPRCKGLNTRVSTLVIGKRVNVCADCRTVMPLEDLGMKDTEEEGQ